MAIRFIRQRQKNDCAIAAVATVVGKSYAEVRRVCGPPGRGLEDFEVLWLMNQFGRWRLSVPRKDWTIGEWAKRYPRCVVSTGMCFDSVFHAVAIVDGEVFCPSGREDSSELRVCYAIVPAQD